MTFQSCSLWKISYVKRKISLAFLRRRVPDSQEDGSAYNCARVDRKWNFSQELIGVKDVGTPRWPRIACSPNYQCTRPRILKVAMVQEDMITSLLKTWYINCRLVPPDHRIRSFFKWEHINSEITLSSVTSNSAHKWTNKHSQNTHRNRLTFGRQLSLYNYTNPQNSLPDIDHKSFIRLEY